jgi:hypothetical protein
MGTRRLKIEDFIEWIGFWLRSAAKALYPSSATRVPLRGAVRDDRRLLGKLDRLTVNDVQSIDFERAKTVNPLTAISRAARDQSELFSKRSVNYRERLKVWPKEQISG